MNIIPQLESPQIKISTGTYSSKLLLSLAESHPFTQQLDVIFPANDALEAALAQLKTTYADAIFKLSDLVENATSFVNTIESQSDYLILSTEQTVDDAWCIDSLGFLTIFLTKESYERLGIMGKRLPFKRAKDERVVQFSLRKGADSPANVLRRRTMIQAWDERREEATGAAEWNVVYCAKEVGTVMVPPFVAEASAHKIQVHEVACKVTYMKGVRVPENIELTACPTQKSGGSEWKEREEDWKEDMHALVEWVGLACLGSQRLNFNDRVDPYVALYEQPFSSSKMGNLTHIRWCGLLSPAFVQLVIDTILTFLNPTDSSPNRSSPPSFVSIISHAVTKTPVAYINPRKASDAQAVRVPREDGEDTWCFLGLPCVRSEKGENDVNWVLVESADKLDSRWG
ncbi:hypothetical protein AMATHDRAFT_75723 [Amanita thiersii Skay4041]|uniref:Uncharacterized protein n=1 Tax=Amanita thiersii Skay4041 TaxID=703135 RepID=A0A2A9NPR8_9AGAR|nr:hypothetical protein AMATHDRAFT_75723 [Amanita thiersii Skay4041]